MRIPLLTLFLIAAATCAAQPVLIVADEIPAMEVLAAKLRAAEGIESKIVLEKDMPQDLSRFRAVVVYIHKDMEKPAEKSFMAYANAGGRLILLHHSISSAKRKNQFWTPFTGVTLPYGELSEGGYSWASPVTIQMINLAPGHFITTHKVEYKEKIPYASPDLGGGTKQYAGFTLSESEIYLNQVLSKPATLLFGVKYKDAKTGITYMQDRGGWLRRSGKGWLLYLMPGHSVKEFEDTCFSRIAINAVIAPLE